jgi:hypothetical protein
MKPIVRILMIVVVVFLATAWYVHWSRTRALNSGDVFVRDETGDKAKPETPPATPANQSAQTQELASNATVAPSGNSSRPRMGAATLPASDSIRRNPPNRTIFAGTGKYQLYRQGDITWRMNTDTGEACILFATETQWRKTIVYDHGCSSR